MSLFIAFIHFLILNPPWAALIIFSLLLSAWGIVYLSLAPITEVARR